MLERMSMVNELPSCKVIDRPTSRCYFKIIVVYNN